MGNLLEGKKEDHDIKEPQISKINLDVHSDVKSNQEKNELMISSERYDMPSDTKENQQEKVEEQEQEQEQEENQSDNNKEEEEEQNQPIIKVEERENIEDKKEEEIIDNINEEEKVDEPESSTNINEENIPYIVEEQEALIANHMDIIKSEAKLLTEEGNLISKIKGITEENYTMEEYVYKIEDIIKTKLKYFQDLKQKIKEYKSLLG